MSWASSRFLELLMLRVILYPNVYKNCSKLTVTISVQNWLLFVDSVFGGNWSQSGGILQVVYLFLFRNYICSYANHAIIRDKFYNIGFRLIFSYFCFFFLFFFFQIYSFMVITIMTSTTNTSFDNHVVHHTILKSILYCPFIKICIY